MNRILSGGSVLLMVLAILMQAAQKYWMAEWFILAAIYFAVIYAGRTK